RWRAAIICRMTQIRKKTKRAGRGQCCPTVEEAVRPRFFKALGDPGRAAILCRLCRCCGPQTVSRIAACCPTDMSVVSRHLAMLRDAGVLSAEKRGKEMHYAVDHAQLAAVLRTMADAVEACCARPAKRKKEKRK
ncbi:MAG: metalloregulator ArsR/SmtB family transcription factor, partial [Phycisphaerae bacterium]